MCKLMSERELYISTMKWPLQPTTMTQRASTTKISTAPQRPLSLAAHFASYHVVPMFESTLSSTVSGFSPLKGLAMHSTTSS